LATHLHYSVPEYWIDLLFLNTDVLGSYLADLTGR